MQRVTFKRNSVMPATLIADIGGTNTRFALVTNGGNPQNVHVIEGDSVPDLETAIARYLAILDIKPANAVLAVAAPVDSDEITMTNRAWRFRLSALKARFGFSDIRGINDFEAVAWALLRLSPNDLRPLGPLGPRPGGVKVALGPGTGLGVSALVPLTPQSEFGQDHAPDNKSDHWYAVASQGGHASFGPGARDEFPVFDRLHATHGWVKGETILSGPGLKRLFTAMHPDLPPRTSPAIVQDAIAGDAPALAVTQLFVRLLGRLCGDLALMFKASGGVYIAGGLGTGLGPLFDVAAFRAAFERHPPYEQRLAAIPTILITNELPGLLGCAEFAAEEFGTEG